MQISTQKVVSINYTLTNPEGKVLDSSQGRAPLTYMQGARNIIPVWSASWKARTWATR
jgi:FKBP-type peptidyl-prolyl cis-trans isomerase SlyD